MWLASNHYILTSEKWHCNNCIVINILLCVFLSVNPPILNPWKHQTQFCLDVVGLNKSCKLSLPDFQGCKNTQTHRRMYSRTLRRQMNTEEQQGHLHQQVIQLFSTGEEDKLCGDDESLLGLLSIMSWTLLIVLMWEWAALVKSNLSFALCLMCLMHLRSYWIICSRGFLWLYGS